MTRNYKRVKTTPEDLRRLYWDNKMSMAMVGTEIGCASSHVNWLMDKWHIPKRNKSQAIKLAIEEGRTERPRFELNANYKGGRINQRGYIAILCPEHPRARNGYVFEHILVWEKTHGKPVPDGWSVHHLNGIKSDNRPKNLFAVPRKSHHYALLLQGLRKRIRKLEAEIRRLRAQRRML